MKLIKLGAFSVWLSFLLSFQANAALITHNGYTLDTDTKIVTDGTTSWLQWSETYGMSFNEISSQYLNNGWQIAGQSNMAALFSAFFPQRAWDSDPSTGQDYGTGWNASEDSPFLDFVELFGRQVNSFVNSDPSDPHTQTSAAFGRIVHPTLGAGFSQYSPAVIRDDWTRCDNTDCSQTSTQSSSALLQRRIFTTSDDNQITFGWALIRTSSTAQPISEPHNIFLLLSGVFLLFRKKLPWNSQK